MTRSTLFFPFHFLCFASFSFHFARRRCLLFLCRKSAALRPVLRRPPNTHGSSHKHTVTDVNSQLFMLLSSFWTLLLVWLCVNYTIRSDWRTNGALRCVLRWPDGRVLTARRRPRNDLAAALPDTKHKTFSQHGPGSFGNFVEILETPTMTFQLVRRCSLICSNS